jgi:hypothetical protein
MVAKLNRFDRILSGTDAPTPGYILKMFEAIKGRPPTSKEIAQLRRTDRAARTRPTSR